MNPDDEDESHIVEELERQLKNEQAQRYALDNKLKLVEEEIRLVRCNTVELQAKVEEEEEFITNNLLKRLEAVKKEKEHIAKQVEIEEEFMTNNLQRKLNQLRKEKGELERHLEAEQEYFVNKLQKQLLEITRQKNALERKLNEGRSGLISQFERTVGDCKHSLHSQSCAKDRDSIAHLEGQVAAMRQHQQQAEGEAHEYRERCELYARELEKLMKEKAKLASQTILLKEKMERLQQEREAEFAQFELSEERQFNLSIRRGSSETPDLDAARSLSLSNTPLTSRDSSRSNSQVRRRPRCQSDLLTRTHSDRLGATAHLLKVVEGEPNAKLQVSGSSSNLTSPGHSTSPTPPPIPSPKPWAPEVSASTLLRRHTEEVLSMSPALPNSPRQGNLSSTAVSSAVSPPASTP
eukprot:EG_transcript_7999